jgi:hypothetical protein
MKGTIKNIFGAIALAAAVGFVVVACDKSDSKETPDAVATADGQLSGTYVDESGELSYTFAGNKMTVGHGDHGHDYTFEIKDGKLIETSDQGTVEYECSLEGDKLTLTKEGQEPLVLTKK